MKLTDKVAVVTGASRGFGRAIALAFAREGADVAVNDLSLEQVQKVSDEVIGLGRDSIAIEADVSNQGQVNRMIEQVMTKFKRIDILINNAGIGSLSSLFEVTEEEWDRMMNVNLKGVFNCSRVVLKSMMEQHYGKIVNIGSVAGKMGGVLIGPHYAASKAAVICLTKSMAKLAASYGVNVNTISPGAMDTDFSKPYPKDKRAALIKAIPLGKMGTPDDIAEATVFLVSDAAGYITGANLDINGGLLMD